MRFAIDLLWQSENFFIVILVFPLYHMYISGRRISAASGYLQGINFSVSEDSLQMRHNTNIKMGNGGD